MEPRPKFGLVLSGSNKKRPRVSSAFDDNEGQVNDSTGSLSEKDRMKEFYQKREAEIVKVLAKSESQLVPKDTKGTKGTEDELGSKRVTTQTRNTGKSRYIESLLASSSKRKSDREVALQRKAAKRAEKERELYGETLSFTTSAYREFKEKQQVEYLEEKKATTASDRKVAMNAGMDKFYKQVLAKRTENL